MLVVSMDQGRLPFLSGQLGGECAETAKPHRHRVELNAAKAQTLLVLRMTG